MTRMSEDIQTFLEQIAIQTEAVIDSASEMMEETLATVDQGIDEFLEPLVVEVEHKLDTLLAPFIVDIEALDQTLEEWASPLRQRLNPLMDQQPACVGCRHYHGKTYGDTFLVCGMHPYGVKTESCPDWDPC